MEFQQKLVKNCDEFWQKKWPQHPDGTEIIKIEIRFGLSIPENSYNGILFEHIDGHNVLISRLVQYAFCLSLILSFGDY